MFNIPNELKGTIAQSYLGEGTNNNYYITTDGQCWKCIKHTTGVRGYYKTEYVKVNLTPRIQNLIDSQKWIYNRKGDE